MGHTPAILLSTGHLASVIREGEVVQAQGPVSRAFSSSWFS
jgi:hypothetical protein